MITAPVLHPATVTVAQARAALDDPHRHLLLIVSDGRLLGTLTREDLEAPTLRATGPALEVARLTGRTTGVTVRLATAYDELVATGDRRRAVVDADGVLLGLLCLKASGTGFCSDAGVAARRGPDS
jgi:CBS domain-containing protein